MKSLAQLLLRLYRLAFSPWLGTNCRFVPSCSCYADEAYARHAFLKASILIVKRLLRCHPYGGSGYDPVPNPDPR